MSRLFSSLKTWAVREAVSVPLYFVLLLPIKPREWYWSLLGIAAKPIQSRPEVASSLFAVLQSRRWIREDLKPWLRTQEAFAQARLGRFDEAAAGFMEICHWPNAGPLRVRVIRSALASLDSERSREQYFSVIGLLARDGDVPIAERGSLLLSRARHYEEQASQAEGDARMVCLRSGYADYAAVHKLGNVPPELQIAAINGQMSTALSGVDLNTAYRVSMDARQIVPMQWRRTLAQHAQWFPEDSIARYQEFARSELLYPNASPVDTYCWLLNIALSLSKCGRLTATSAALRAASEHSTAWANAPAESRWNIVAPENFGIELTDPNSTVAIPLASFVALMAPASIPAEAVPRLDDLLLGTHSMGTDPVAALADAVEMLHGVGLSRTDAVSVCEVVMAPAGFADALQSLRNELQGSLQFETIQSTIPSGLSEAGRARVAELLIGLAKIGTKKKSARDILEEIGEHAMDVTPVESKIDMLVWLAALASSHDCGSNAESCLHAARATCMRYENPSVRLPLMLNLCRRIRHSSLQTSFDSFYKSTAMEGRTLATQTWIHASGYNQEEREGLKQLQREFEDIL